MADLAVVALGLDATGMTSGAAQANRALTGVEKQMDEAQKKAAALQTQLQYSGKQMLAFGGSAKQAESALSALGGPVGEAAGKLQNLGSQLEGLVASFGLVGGAAVGAVAGVAALGASLVNLTLGGVKLSDEMGDIAEGTGLTIEQVQRLSAAIKLSGEDVGFLERSFRTFQGVIQEAIDEPGKKAAQALLRLGVDAREAGKNSADAFINTIARLKEIRETTEGAVASNIAFGRGIGALVRSSVNLQDVLKGTRGALEDDFIIANEKAIASGQALDTQINKISNSWDVFKQNLAGTKVGDVVADGFDSITGALKTMSVTMAFVDKQIAGSTYLQVLFGFGKAAISPFSLVGKAAPEGLTPQFRGLFDIGQSQAGGFDSRGIGGGITTKKTATGARDTSAERIAEQLAREAKKELEASIDRKNAADKLIKETEDLSTALNKLNASTALNPPSGTVDTIFEKLLRAGATQFPGAAAPPITAGAIPGKQPLVALSTEEIVSAARKQKISDELGKVFEDFVFQITTARATIGEAFKGLALGVLDTFAAEFAAAFQKSLKKAFIDPLAGWLEDALSEMFSGISGKGLGRFFKAIGTSFVGLFAEGGTIPSNHWGIVGERGPEIAFAGSSPMQIAPMGGGGAISVNMNFAISTPTGDVSQRTQDQLADAAARGIERAQRLRGAR